MRVGEVAARRLQPAQSAIGDDARRTRESCRRAFWRQFAPSGALGVVAVVRGALNGAGLVPSARRCGACAAVVLENEDLISS